MFLLQVIFFVVFVYGILSLVQDVFNEFSYKKISHNMKIVIFTNELEKNIEKFIIEFYNIRKVNLYKEIVVIDLEEKDDINKIKTRLYNSEVNVKILNRKEGKQYIHKYFENENISFL